ncbi:MAG: group II intron maturase-specific domain-containing protein [Thermoleophilia bacterium]
MALGHPLHRKAAGAQGERQENCRGTEQQASVSRSSHPGRRQAGHCSGVTKTGQRPHLPGPPAGTGAISFKRMIGELNQFLSGWVAYLRYAPAKSNLRSLDGWTRRKLRCMRLKQRKRPKAIADFLMGLSVPEWRAWLLACLGKGWWRMAGSPQANEAMTVPWFREQGLVNLSERYEALKAKRNRRGTEYVCPVV